MINDIISFCMQLCEMYTIRSLCNCAQVSFFCPCSASVNEELSFCVLEIFFVSKKGAITSIVEVLINKILLLGELLNLYKTHFFDNIAVV